MEKTQRVENARLQIRTFQAKQRGFPGSSSGQEEKSIPPKSGRVIGGVRLSRMSKGAPPKGGQVGLNQQRGVSQGRAASISRGPCGYCGRPNHMNKNCLRKERKCLCCGSSNHQITNCPVPLREGSGTQQPVKTNPGQFKVEGTRQKVPTRVYSLE